MHSVTQDPLTHSCTTGGLPKAVELFARCSVRAGDAYGIESGGCFGGGWQRPGPNKALCVIFV